MRQGVRDSIVDGAAERQRLAALPRGNSLAIRTRVNGARGEAERAMIERTLVETEGRIGAAAGGLKVSRTTFGVRKKALGIGGSPDVRKAERRD